MTLNLKHKKKAHNMGSDPKHPTPSIHQASKLLDASGNIVAHYEYSPFGKQTIVTGTYTLHSLEPLQKPASGCFALCSLAVS